jgi:hypothetical protein
MTKKRRKLSCRFLATQHKTQEYRVRWVKERKPTISHTEARRGIHPVATF